LRAQLKNTQVAADGRQSRLEPVASVVRTTNVDLKGKVCLVTGASSGIGRATALQLAQRGAVVAMAARREQQLREIAEEIGGQSSIHLCDLGDAASVLDLADDVLALHGQIDVLVNNAAELVAGEISAVDLESLDRCFQINLLSPFLLCGRLAPLMAARGEGVVASLTTAIASGRRGLGAYAASKAALDSLTQTLRQEVGGKGVAVFSYDPGWVQTAMAPDGKESPDDAGARLVAHIEAAKSARQPLT